MHNITLAGEKNTFVLARSSQSWRKRRNAKRVLAERAFLGFDLGFDCRSASEWPSHGNTSAEDRYWIIFALGARQSQAARDAAVRNRRRR